MISRSKAAGRPAVTSWAGGAADSTSRSRTSTVDSQGVTIPNDLLQFALRFDAVFPKIVELAYRRIVLWFRSFALGLGAIVLSH